MYWLALWKGNNCLFEIFSFYPLKENVDRFLKLKDVKMVSHSISLTSVNPLISTSIYIDTVLLVLEVQLKH